MHKVPYTSNKVYNSIELHYCISSCTSRAQVAAAELDSVDRRMSHSFSRSESEKEASAVFTLHSSLAEEASRRTYNTIVSATVAESSASGVLMSVQVADADQGRSEETAEPKEKCVCRCYRQKGSVVEHAVYFCAIAVASYAGVVIRAYLSQLAQWNGVPLFPSLSAEVVGTVVMGFIAAHQKSLGNNHKALYQAIATGLCGCITTFSSWNFEAVKVLLQLDQNPPDNVTRIIGWATTLILGVGMPIAALLFGRHLAHLSPWSDFSPRAQEENGEQNRSSFSKFLVVLERIAFTASWIMLTCLVLSVLYHFSQFKLMFSVVFAPVGAYIRWHLAPLNSLFTNFKLGTFIVNVGGSWLLGATIVAKAHLSTQLGADHLALMALSGFGTGFCGCLTTVSTFAVELSTLPLRWSYVYAIASILSAQLGLLIIKGTYEWVG